MVPVRVCVCVCVRVCVCVCVCVRVCVRVGDGLIFVFVFFYSYANTTGQRGGYWVTYLRRRSRTSTVSSEHILTSSPPTYASEFLQLPRPLVAEWQQFTLDVAAKLSPVELKFTLLGAYELIS